MFSNNNNSSNINHNHNHNQRRSISTNYHYHHYQEVVEEAEAGPEYRSVNMNRNMMNSPLLPSMPIPLSQKTFLSSPLPMLSMPIPMPSKLIRANRSSPINKERATMPFPSSRSSSSSSSSTSTSTSPPHHRWIIRELHELPSDYVLVRTNVYVKQNQDNDDDADCSNNSPQLVANRICQTLKSLSITVIDDNDNDYDSNNSTKVFADEGLGEIENALFVETQNDVKFAIRLFAASSNSNSNNNNMIVVEIQRTSGCTFEFRDAAKAILRSAANKKQTIGKAKRRFTIPLSIPKRSKKDLAGCIKDDFKIAYQMIRSTKYDTQVLGLESMEQMTRKKSNDEVKNVVARSVLGCKESCDCDNDNCDCLKQLLLLLDTDKSRTVNHQSSSFILLRRKVLTVLANSLEAIINSTTTTTTVGGESSPANTTLSTNDNDNDRTFVLKTNKPFLSVLLSTLQETHIRPHDAFQAVRCLRYLLPMSSFSPARESEIDIITAMMKIHPDALDIISSYTCGGDDYNHNCHHHYHHEGLEQESNMLMSQLQQTNVMMMSS